MRELLTADLFAALRLAKELGIREEMKRMAAALQDGKVTKATQTEVGMELIMEVLANCGSERAEKAFYDFLSGPTETPPKELKIMPLTAFAELVREMVESIDVEHWKAFFTQLAGLLKKQS